MFTVVKQQGELPVYHVKNVKKPKDIRVLHRNHLLRCDQLSPEVFDDEAPKVRKQPRKQVPRERAAAKVDGVDDDPVSGGDSEGEDDFEIQVYPEVPVSNDKLPPLLEVQMPELLLPAVQSESMVDFDLVAPDVEEVPAVDSGLPVALEDGIAVQSPVHSVPGSETDGEEGDSDESDEVEEPPRRVRAERKMFTYETLGGNPSWSAQEGRKKKK